MSLVGATTRSFGLVTFGTVVPEYDNQVRLHPERKDEFGFPVLEINLRYPDHAWGTLKAARARLQAILLDAGYGSNLARTDDHLIPGRSVHYGGAVRMHASPEYGMLDGWSRIHAVPNVVVADASSFTTGAEKNPTLTVMALAARAADRLANDLKQGQLVTRKPRSHAIPAAW
jgi:choline dehydrogenase-like flavoprotein